MTDKPKSISKFILSDTVLFDLILLIFFLVLAIMSFEYNPRARSIPLGLGILGAAMILLQLLADAIPALRPKLRFVIQGGILDTDKKPGAAGSKSTIPAPQKETQKSVHYWLHVVRLLSWLVGFVVLLTLVNYLIAVAVFVILITKLEAKEGWTKAIVLALCVDASFFVLFDLILQAHL